jgi:hypothetical protein
VTPRCSYCKRFMSGRANGDGQVIHVWCRLDQEADERRARSTLAKAELGHSRDDELPHELNSKGATT